MKKLHLCILLFFLSRTFSQNLTIAVNDLDVAGVEKSTASIISDRVRSELFNTGKFTVIERNQMEEILKEQGFQQSGCTNNDCAVEIGQLLGVNYMFAGKIGKIGKTYTLSLRMIDVQTGKILTTSNTDCKCEIDDVLSKSTKILAEEISRKVAALNSDETCIIKITSKPAGADLFINEVKKGKTPFIDTLVAGSYPISLQLKNYQTENDILALKESGTLIKEYALKPGKEKKKFTKRRIIPLTISGLSIVGGIVGGIVMNNSASENLNDGSKIKSDFLDNGNEENFDHYNSLYKNKMNDAKQDMIIRSACYGVAGLGALGLIFTFAF